MKNKHFSKIFEVINNQIFILVIMALSMMPTQTITAQCSSTTDCSQSFTTLSANKVSLINPNGVTYNNMNIEINGTFTVDRNLTLNNCRIKMGENARIITSGAVQLTLTCSRFFNCSNQRWDRIHIAKDCRLFIKDNFFQDANAALYFEPGYRVPKYKVLPLGPSIQWVNIVENNTFDKNVIGLETGIKVVFNPCFFLRNTFIQSGLLNASNVSTTGVRFRSTLATLGNGTNSNTFNGLTYGIYMESSTVKLINFVFEKMRDYSFNQTNFKASGIVAFESDLSVSHSDFLMSTYAGIVTRGGRKLDVQKCEFRSEHTGLDEQKYGVYVADNSIGGTLSIKENEFNLLTENAEHAIYVEKTPSSATGMLSESTIYKNIINIKALNLFSTGGTMGITISVKKDSYQDRLFVAGNTCCFQSLSKP